MAAPISTLSGVDVYVARSLDDMHVVFALRALVYMGEQNCPFEEEFDGNDLAGATHFIAKIGAEPCGVCRVRWFAAFAKLERVCVTRKRRHGPVVRALWRAVADVAARKGYARVLGHAQLSLLPLWGRIGGFVQRFERPAFAFSGLEYVEGVAPLPTRVDALDLETPALTLLRPEGDWDQPGVLEAGGADIAARR